MAMDRLSNWIMTLGCEDVDCYKYHPYIIYTLINDNLLQINFVIKNSRYCADLSNYFVASEKLLQRLI